MRKWITQSVFIKEAFPMEKVKLPPITDYLKAKTLGGFGITGITRKMANKQL